MVLQVHVTNKNHHISITRVSIATKLGRMIASLVGLLPIMSHDPLITWHWEIQGSLTGGGSACKRLSRHQQVLLTILQNLQENTCVGVSFFIKFQAERLQVF